MLIGLLPVLLSGAVYWPILGNYFAYDDFLHLYRIANTGPLEFFLTPHGGHILLVRNLIFYAFYKAFGLAPTYYFASVLVTHLVNVYLLFRLLQCVTGSASVAVFGATLWGTCPISEGVLGWYSVYGHALVATIQLSVLYDLLRLTAQQRPISGARMAAWYLLLLAGVTCFGVGIPMAMTFAVVAYLLLPRSPQRRTVCLAFSSLAIVVPVIFLAFHALYARISGSSANAAASLMDSLRDWRPTIEMLGRLIAYGASSLAFPWACGEEPQTRLSAYATLGVYALAVAAVLARSSPDTKRRLLAFTFMVVTTYAVIAIGRASFVLLLQKSLDWGAMQSRYHYVGPLAIAISLCLILNDLPACAFFTARRRDLLLVLWMSLNLALYLRSGRPIDHHDSARLETQTVLKRIEIAASAVPEGRTAYIANHPFASIGWDPGGAFPGWAGTFMIAHPQNRVLGRNIYFVERDPILFANAQRRPDARIASLLVTPNHAAASGSSSLR